jgi:hypothetical protein
MDETVGAARRGSDAGTQFEETDTDLGILERAEELLVRLRAVLDKVAHGSSFQ